MFFLTLNSLSKVLIIQYLLYFSFETYKISLWYSAQCFVIQTLLVWFKIKIASFTDSLRLYSKLFDLDRYVNIDSLEEMKFSFLLWTEHIIIMLCQSFAIPLISLDMSYPFFLESSPKS